MQQKKIDRTDVIISISSVFNSIVLCYTGANPISKPTTCKHSLIKPTTISSSQVIILHKEGYK